MSPLNVSELHNPYPDNLASSTGNLQGLFPSELSQSTSFVFSSVIRFPDGKLPRRLRWLPLLKDEGIDGSVSRVLAMQAPDSKF